MKFITFSARLFCFACMRLVFAVTLTSAVAFSAASAAPGPLVYVVTFNNLFGTVDLSTGAFHQIGPPTPESQADLVWHDGSLFSLVVFGPDTGSLARINPATGEVTIIGPTGLGSNAFNLAEVRGKLYLTDFNIGGGSQNIYSVDPQTGAATLIGRTAIPADVNAPFTTNADGTLNLCDETLYGFAGKLYATFDSGALNTSTLTFETQIPAALYRIDDPSAGGTTEIGPTKFGLGSAVEVNGKYYAFYWVTTAFTQFGPQVKSQLFSLDLATGEATPVQNAAGPVFVDAAASGIAGAAPAPTLSGGTADSAGTQSLEERKLQGIKKWR